MVTWKVTFALGGTDTDVIDLSDAENLVDWDPEFKGELISSFFKTEYTWIQGLQSVSRGDLSIAPKNFLVVVGRKWGESRTREIPMGVLFEFTDGDLRLRAVGPKSLSEKSGVDGGDLLLGLVSDLFDKPNLWRTKIIIASMPKSEWRVIGDIIGEDPWGLIEQGRRIARTEPKKAMGSLSKALKIFDVLSDVNGKFHAVFAQAELALDTKNYDLTRDLLSQAQILASQLGDTMLEENVASTEGILLYESRLYNQAIPKFEEALTYAKKANRHKAVINAYCNLGECYYRLKQFEEAMKQFDKAHSIAEERNENQSLAIAQVYLAKVLIAQRNVDQAEYYLREAKERFEQVEDGKGLMMTHGTFGDLEAAQNNFEGALIHYELASESAQSLKKHVFQEHYYQKAQNMRNRLMDSL